MKPLAITCGDPAGVGPEIIEQWARKNSDLAKDCVFVGPKTWLDSLAGSTTVAVGGLDFEATPGQPTEAGARIALAAMEEAAAGCREGKYGAVVTGPVSKGWLAKVGYPYPGQTEFFAARWGGEPTMGFVGERLKVVLVTWHIPLREVPNALDEAIVNRAIKQADALAKAYGANRPRIAVCGLNPHAGEGGILGTEERDFLDPFLDRLRAQIPGLSSALPPDTVFHRTIEGEFDVVVALYHDQGLGPLKTVDFHSAVNVTLGLPYVRTSPDHGTAFSIAGKGEARMGSFHNAVRCALRLSGGNVI